MAKQTKANTGPCFLDTSSVIWQLHGHALQESAVRQAVGESRVEVSNFIRMEYLRSVVVNLIELYFLIKESDSVSDALIDWSEKVNQDRKLKIVLRTLSGWITSQEEWQDRDKALRRLGEFIVRLVRAFDDACPGRSKDHLHCQLGRVSFSRELFSEDLLLEFHGQFRGIQASVPACQLCRFRDKQQRLLVQKKIDLYSPARCEEFKKNQRIRQAGRAAERGCSFVGHDAKLPLV